MSARLLKSTAVVGAMTFISRMLGLVRDMVFANAFGAGSGTDAFFVAFKIPNFLRRLFAEGAFSQSFVPVLAEVNTQRGIVEVRRLVADVSGVLASLLLLLTALALLAAPGIVALFAPGFLDEPAKFSLTSEMLRITFPYLLFISLTAMAGGILNTYGRFAVPAFTPVWLNVCMIAATWWAAPLFATPIVALAWGVFAAGVLQLGFQLPFLAQLGLLRWPRWGWSNPDVRRIIRLMLPAIFGSSVVQINLLLDTLIASFLISGSVSWLYYSDRLVEFPLGVFGIALATVILPSLSQKHASADPQAFARTLDWALRWVALIGTAATVGLILLAGPLLTTLFQHGEFNAHDVRMAQLSLMAFATGLPAFILIKVLAPGFYARQDTRTPVRIGIYAMVANMALNLLFVVPMVWAGWQGPHAGLALATALAAWLNAGLLFHRLHRDGVYQAQPGWTRLLVQILLAALLMGGLLWWGLGELELWTQWDSARRIKQLLLWVPLGAMSYLAVLLLLGVRPRQLLGHS